MKRASRSSSASEPAELQAMARSMLPSATRAACVCDGITQASIRSCAMPETRVIRSGGCQLT
jgi:hypothetical protein